MKTVSIDDYILEHSDKEPDYLAAINRDTWLRQINPRMISGHLQGRVLSMIAKMIRPARILELGTFTGYSALCLAEGLDDNGRLDTIEIDDELEDVIRNNIARSPFADKITLHVGDALEIIPKLGMKYDLVFLDADKSAYSLHYEAALEALKPGGFILADNTLWSGKVVEAAHHHNDKQTHEILHFNDSLVNDERVEQVILPLRDGLTIIRKKLKVKR